MPPLLRVKERWRTINRSDVIAIQEVRKDLKAFTSLVSILGSNYEYIFTDVTEGKAGNQERLCFVFDTRKGSFWRISGRAGITAPGPLSLSFAVPRKPKTLTG